jgi:hypothetical protein
MNHKEETELTKATRELARSIANLSNVLAMGLKPEPEKAQQTLPPAPPVRKQS